MTPRTLYRRAAMVWSAAVLAVAALPAGDLQTQLAAWLLATLLGGNFMAIVAKDAGDWEETK